MKRNLVSYLMVVQFLLLGLLPLFAPAPIYAQSIGADKITRTVLSSAARGTTTSSVFNIEHRTGMVAFLNVTAQSGTSPTLDVVIQDSPTGAAPWFTLASFTQVTGSTSSQTLVPSRAPAGTVRFVGTVGGSSTPTFTYSLSFIAYSAPTVAVTTTQGGALTATGLTLYGASGETSVIQYATENITLSTGGATTSSSANLLPANALILGVTGIVTTAIAGVDATAIQLGVSGTATRFGSGSTLTAGGTIVGGNHLKGGVSTDATGPWQASAAQVLITLSGGSDQTPSAGAVRVTVAYIQFGAPTS